MSPRSLLYFGLCFCLFISEGILSRRLEAQSEPPRESLISNLQEIANRSGRGTPLTLQRELRRLALEEEDLIRDLRQAGEGLPEGEVRKVEIFTSAERVRILNQILQVSGFHFLEFVRKPASGSPLNHLDPSEVHPWQKALPFFLLANALLFGAAEAFANRTEMSSLHGEQVGHFWFNWAPSIAMGVTAFSLEFLFNRYPEFWTKIFGSPGGWRMWLRDAGVGLIYGGVPLFISTFPGSPSVYEGFTPLSASLTTLLYMISHNLYARLLRQYDWTRAHEVRIARSAFYSGNIRLLMLMPGVFPYAAVLQFIKAVGGSGRLWFRHLVRDPLYQRRTAYLLDSNAFPMSSFSRNCGWIMERLSSARR